MTWPESFALVGCFFAIAWGIKVSLSGMLTQATTPSKASVVVSHSQADGVPEANLERGDGVVLVRWPDRYVRVVTKNMKAKG